MKNGADAQVCRPFHVHIKRHRQVPGHGFGEGDLRGRQRASALKQADGDTAQRVQQTAGCRFRAAIPWGRQVRVFLDERTVADEAG